MMARNAAASVVQVLLSALIMFLLYRAILEMVGPERLGIWSVVVATTSASRLGELGLGASVTRFVAMYRARGDFQAAGDAVQTAVISIGTIFSIIVLPVYLLLRFVFEHLFQVNALSEALDLLPYAIFSIIVSLCYGVLQSGLDGCQRFDIRAGIVVAGQFVFLLGALTLTPLYGLQGLAWAQIAQGLFLLGGAWLLLRQNLTTLARFPCRWRKSIFLEMLSYGLQLQVGSISMLLFEPLTKAMLGKFGGLSSAGYFEMASQFISKARNLIVSTNQIIVPVAAELIERDPAKLREMYSLNLRLLIFLSIPLYVTVFVCSPFLSTVWIGHHEQQFVIFVTVLAIAWGLNTVNVPAYYINQGTGKVAWNMAGHVITGLINVGLGMTCGPYFGANGVVIGTALSLVIGSISVVYFFHREHRFSWSLLVPQESYLLIVMGGVTCCLGCIWYIATFQDIGWSRSIVYLFLSPVLLLPTLMCHPLRHEIQKKCVEIWIRNR